MVFHVKTINNLKQNQIGSRSVSVEQIEQIVRLTEQGKFRKEIAQQVGVSTFTVYKYQKKFDLV